MGTDHDAFAALDADIGIPHRNFLGNVAFLPLRGTAGIGAVAGQSADRNLVSLAGNHLANHIPDKGRGRVRNWLVGLIQTRQHFVGQIGIVHLIQMLQGLIDRLNVHLHDLFALLTVGLADGLLNLLDRFLAGQHTRYGKETNLHHRVDPAAHASLFGHLVGIDHIEPDLLLDHLILQPLGQMAPGFFRAVGTVEQKDCPWFGCFQQLKLLDELPLMAGDEIGAGDQIGGTDWLGAKPQVRYCHRSRLLGVIDKVALGVVFGFFADDFDRVLVGPHRAIGPQPKEDRPHHIVRFCGEAGIKVEGGVTKVVMDANGEVVLRRSCGQVIENRLDHSWGELL